VLAAGCVINRAVTQSEPVPKGNAVVAGSTAEWRLRADFVALRLSLAERSWDAALPTPEAVIEGVLVHYDLFWRHRRRFNRRSAKSAAKLSMATLCAGARR
jgi:hypothetical protein